MEEITNIIRTHVALAVFLTLALGFLIGRIRIGNFRVGAMLGCLFAGVIVGQIGIKIAPETRIIFFDLFLFATGYKVGPQFFYGLKKGALPQLLLTVVICVTCLVTAYLAARFMGFDVGTAAGLLAGAFTESTIIGTASDAINRIQATDAEKLRLVNNIPVAYAVTYLVGTTALVWFISSAAPRILGINLRKEAEKLSGPGQVRGEMNSFVNSAYEEWLIRAISLSDDTWTSIRVSDFERSIHGARIFVERVRKNGKILEAAPNLVMEKGDTIVIAARQRVMLEQLAQLGPESHDRELLDFPMITTEVMVSRKEVSGQSLLELAEQYGHGVMLKKLIRGGQELPFEPNMIIYKGDVLTLFGRERDVSRAAQELGFARSSEANTDIVAVSAGIVIGGLIGMLSIRVLGIDITLSVSGGALLLGLFFGWLQSKSPSFSRIPEPALWIFDTMGLAIFLGIVGISAGPTFISGLKQVGFGIIPVGLIVALLPHIVGLLFGRFVLKMNPLILLGAQCGAGTTTTALKALQDASGSKIPVLGYTIPYALGNILLTAWGPVIVSLMTR